MDQAETGGPAAASAVLQPLPAFAAAATAVLQLLSAVLQPMLAFAASAAANFAVLQPVPQILQPLPAVASSFPVVTRDIGESSKSPESGGVGLSIGPLLLKQMEDEAEVEAVPLGHEQYTENSPSGEVHERAPRPPASVWTTVKLLRDVILMGNRFSDDDGRAVYQFTHVCVRCLKLLKMTFDKTRQVWKTNEALHHLKVEHGKDTRTLTQTFCDYRSLIVRDKRGGGGSGRRRWTRRWCGRFGGGGCRNGGGPWGGARKVRRYRKRE